MEPLDSLTRWGERLRDRARARSFGRFVLRRMLDDDLFQAAGSLSYTTVFALVPLSVVVFGILTAFPVFSKWSQQLIDYIFVNFVPTAARSLETNLETFADNAEKLTALGVIALVASLLITLSRVEATFNRVWRVKSARPKLSRFLVYWTVLTLGTLIAAASLAISARFFALSVFDSAVGFWLESTMLWLAPLMIEVLALAAIYRVVPHRTVQWRHALAGAVLAAFLIELIKGTIGLYLANFDSFSRLYGTLASIPVFMLWVFLSWVAVLLGASLASSMSAFRYQPVAMRLPVGYEIYGLLRLLARFDEARRDGQGLHTDDILRLEPILTDALAQEMLAQLGEIKVVRRAEGGEWLLSRDLADLTLAELYEACQLRIPVAEAHLPCRDDALGKSAVAALDELRVPLRALLKRRIATIQPEKE